MTGVTDEVLESLRALRDKTDLTLKPLPHLRDTFVHKGKARPLVLRQYQINAVHNMARMKRFVLGDDCGLGKCQTKESLVSSVEKGLLSIADFREFSTAPSQGALRPDSFYRIKEPVHIVLGEDRLRVKSFYYGGVKPTVKVSTRYGFGLEATLVHPVLVLRGGEHKWVQLQHVEIGDYLCIDRPHILQGPRTEPPLDSSGGLPDRMSPDLARFLGYYIGEGSLTQRHAVAISQCPTANPEIHADILRLYQTCLGVLPKHPDVKDLHLYSTSARRWLVSNGLGYTLSRDREVPKCVLQATVESQRQFLMSYFEGEGHVNKTHLEVSTASETLSKQIQIMLLRFGIVSNRSPKRISGRDHVYWRTSICGLDAELFRDRIGLISTRKVAALNLLCGKQRNTNHDVVPTVQGLFDGIRSALKAHSGKGGLKQFGNWLVCD